MRTTPWCALIGLFAASLAQAGTVRGEVFIPSIEAPVAVAFAPGDTSRVFVLGRFGRITIHDAVTGVARPQPFIDLSALVAGFNNSGMVGLVFDPNYATNGYFYVNYQGSPTLSTLARYRVSANPDLADSGSATIIHRITRTGFGHWGGALLFSPLDGYLYYPTGDSGNGLVADPDNAAQNLASPQGKVLRLDVSGDDFPADPNRNYRIPPTNPYLAVPGALPEIWSLGLRNPFQCAFDRATGDLWIADVGQDAREEINFQPAGSLGAHNYAWRCREGDICSPYGGCDCSATTFTHPIHTYPHSVGCSISGGRVYRGSAIPSLQGWYLFTDYCAGFLHAVRPNGTGVDFRDLSAQITPATPFQGVTSLSDGANGELYITDIQGVVGGQVIRIVPGCPADLDNGSGTGIPDNGVTIDDLVYFLGLFEAGDVDADLDDGTNTGTPDLGVTIDDLIYFLTRFEVGC